MSDAKDIAARQRQLQGSKGMTARTLGENTGGGLASQHSAATNTSLFYDFDLSGNATVLVNTEGQPVQNYFYSGFTALGSTSLAKSKLGPPMQVRGMDEGMGGLKANPAAEVYYNPLQLSARFGLQDMGNGMNYARQRILYRKFGRWPSRDPIDFRVGDANLYRWVENDPVNWADPNVASWWKDLWQHLFGTSQQKAPPTDNTIYGNRGPSGALFLRYYCQVDYAKFPTEKDRPAIAKIIGGTAGQYLRTHENCTGRLSYALNRSGLTIPKFRPYSNVDHDSPWSMTRSSKIRFIYSALGMDLYLKHALGLPMYHVGVMGIDPKSPPFLGSMHIGHSVAIFASCGNVGMLRAGYRDPYIKDMGAVDVWVLPS